MFLSHCAETIRDFHSQELRNHSSGMLPAGPMLATGSKDYDDTACPIGISSREANLFGVLCGEAYLDDSVAVVDHWKIEFMMEHLRREMESRPRKVCIYCCLPYWLVKVFVGTSSRP